MRDNFVSDIALGVPKTSKNGEGFPIFYHSCSGRLCVADWSKTDDRHQSDPAPSLTTRGYLIIIHWRTCGLARMEVEVLNDINLPQQSASKPLRMPIKNRFSSKFCVELIQRGGIIRNRTSVIRKFCICSRKERNDLVVKRFEAKRLCLICSCYLSFLSHDCYYLPEEHWNPSGDIR